MGHAPGARLGTWAAAPFLVLPMGPVTGIVLVSVCGNCGLGARAVSVLRGSDWKKFAIPAAALAGAGGPAFSVQAAPGAWWRFLPSAVVPREVV